MTIQPLEAIGAAVRRQFPGLCSEGPVVLALQSSASRDLLFAQMPAAQAEWTPASQWLSRQPLQTLAPVVPVYVDNPERAGIRVGKAIRADVLTAWSDTAERLRYLRWRTSLLAERTSAVAAAPAQEAVAPEVDVELVAADVAALGPEARLCQSGGYEVLLAPAPRIPHALTEIGRLREIAFRAAGEGTGRALDLDAFDQDYLHLFVWNSAARQIAGGYRLRCTGGGPASLYTATLFQYGDEFLKRLGPAVELGRSFIRVEYQKSFAPLLLLWKGIGRFVASNPSYRTLFGPVSISSQYQSLSRELMIAFLEKRELLADLATLVRPRNAPARRPSVTAEFCRDLDELSDAVADVEPGKLGVPVLLRHYLRLGGKLLGFNVDRNFANALDGLIVVDLIKTDPRLLERYLGKPEAAALLAFHETSCPHSVNR